MDEQIDIVIAASPLGLILGKFSMFDEQNRLHMDRPQSIVQAAPNKFGLMNIHGSPSSMIFPPNTLYWVVGDEELKRIYLQATTGLTIVKGFKKGVH